MLTLEKPMGTADWLRLHGLYRSAFPPSERKPFGIIRKMYRQGRSDIWCIRQDGEFAGFAATVNGGSLILLDYLAVRAALRGQGIGSGAMELLQVLYAQKGLFVEIESTLCPAANREERIKRKQFYLNGGMEAMGTTARVFGVDMELLGSRCCLDFEQYRSFYRDYYSAWAAEHIGRIP